LFLVAGCEEHQECQKKRCNMAQHWIKGFSLV
jgi:hypothetical protein